MESGSEYRIEASNGHALNVPPAFAPFYEFDQLLKVSQV